MKWESHGVTVECRVTKAGNLGATQFYRWVANFTSAIMNGHIESNAKFTSVDAAWKHVGVSLSCFNLQPPTPTAAGE